MEKLLGGIKQSYSFDLLLETKRPEQKFQAYKPGGRLQYWGYCKLRTVKLERLILKKKCLMHLQI